MENIESRKNMPFLCSLALIILGLWLMRITKKLK